jgi:hypothetical protein
MVTAALLRPIRLILVAVLALGLTVSAYAHQMPVDPDSPALDLVAFALATGADAADVCGDGPTGGEVQPRCLACQIAGALLPPPMPALPVDLRLTAGGPVVPAAFGPVPAVLRDPAHPAQGPPVT